jgi:hypothetical protein
MKYLIFLSLFLIFSYQSLGNHLHKIPENLDSNFCKDNPTTNNQVVYVCMGAYSQAYHSQPNCAGLNNCKGEIKYTDANYAVYTLGRSPCCRCWSNVNGGCRDDAQYAGGGGGGDAFALIAVAVVATSVIVLSNDVYLHPLISFYKPRDLNDEKIINPSIGWTFGFRKRFAHSALEYGLSSIKSKVEYNNGFGDVQYSYDSRIGGHFNFVHQLFYNKTPSRLKIYLGPSINYVYDFGYGGIIGADLKIFDRLSFDFRYELTTQTNQFQAGLIFTYQKKYFWQRR